MMYLGRYFLEWESLTALFLSSKTMRHLGFLTAQEFEPSTHIFPRDRIFPKFTIALGPTAWRTLHPNTRLDQLLHFFPCLSWKYARAHYPDLPDIWVPEKGSRDSWVAVANDDPRTCMKVCDNECLLFVDQHKKAPSSALLKDMLCTDLWFWGHPTEMEDSLPLTEYVRFLRVGGSRLTKFSCSGLETVWFDRCPRLEQLWVRGDNIRNINIDACPALENIFWPDSTLPPDVRVDGSLVARYPRGVSIRRNN